MSKTKPLGPSEERDMHPRPEFLPRYPGSGRLAGKVAIITGGDSGIGKATALLFAEEGASVVFGYNESVDDARETEELINERGGSVVSLRGDVGQKEHCEALVSEALSRFRRLDILVNNAGDQHVREDLTAVTEMDLEETFRTNFFGCFFMIQAALPHLKKGAAIINTASITHYRGHELLVDYAASKGAIVALTRSLAARLADEGIRVNAVAPGPIWTPLITKSFPPDKVAEFGKHTPFGRPGQPNEVAPSFLFLACEDSSYMSGQTLHPNGGQPVAG